MRRNEGMKKMKEMKTKYREREKVGREEGEEKK